MICQTIAKLFGYIRARYWHARGLMLLRRRGASSGDAIRFYGLPIVNIHKDSTLTIGRDVVLCSDSRYTALGVSKPVILRTLAPGATITIGDEVGLSGTTICAAASVTIGDRCLLGADTVIADTDFHPIPAGGRRRAPLPSPKPADAVRIANDVFLGYGVVVLKGVSIGVGAVVGARSVVSRDVPPYSIVAGSPARVVGTVARS